MFNIEWNLLLRNVSAHKALKVLMAHCYEVLKNQSTLGPVIMHQGPKLQMCPSGFHLTINYKTFLLLSVFSRCPTAITQGPSKWPGPLYRSKIKVDQSTSCGYSKLVSQDA